MERDDVKSYVRVANETVAAEKTADEDLAHMVAKRTTAVGAIAKDEAPEEQEGDAQVVEHVEGAWVVKRQEVAADVRSANGEATDRHAEVFVSESE